MIGSWPRPRMRRRDLEAVDTGQHQVDHRDLDAALARAGQQLQARLAAGDGVDLMAVPTQHQLHSVPYGHVVLDQQHMRHAVDYGRGFVQLRSYPQGESAVRRHCYVLIMRPWSGHQLRP